VVNRILVVGDFQGSRELIREALTSSEYQFSEAENARDVLQITRQQAADLVITDVKMPGISSIAGPSPNLELNSLPPVFASTCGDSRRRSSRLAH
jgi:CheY-like chemotaxis protein